MARKKEIKKFEEAEFGEEIKQEIVAPEVKETLEELREKIRIAEEEAKAEEVIAPEIEPPEIEPPAKKKAEPIAIIKSAAMAEPGVFQYVIEANYLLHLGVCDLRQ